MKLFNIIENILEESKKDLPHSFVGRSGLISFEIRTDFCKTIEYVKELIPEDATVPFLHIVVKEASTETLLHLLKKSIKPKRFKQFDSDPSWTMFSDAKKLDGLRIAVSPDESIVVIDEGEKITCLYSCAGPIVHKIAVRILREASLASVAGNGMVLHASAFEWDQGAWIVVGPSGAGKTTLAIEMAENGGGSLIGNDYVLVRDGRVGALPISWRIGMGTVSGSAALRGAQASLPPPISGLGRKDASDLLDPMISGSSQKTEITPRRLAEIIDSHVVGESSIDGFILLGGENTPRFETITWGSLAPILEPYLKTHENSVWRDRWIEPLPMRTPESSFVEEECGDHFTTLCYFSPDLSSGTSGTNLSSLLNILNKEKI